MTAEEGKAEAERAMTALRQAVAAGFNAVGRLRSDPSLGPLRSREVFQKLVNELDTKVSKMLGSSSEELNQLLAGATGFDPE